MMVLRPLGYRICDVGFRLWGLWPGFKLHGSGRRRRVEAAKGVSTLKWAEIGCKLVLFFLLNVACFLQKLGSADIRVFAFGRSFAHIMDFRWFPSPRGVANMERSLKQAS